MIIENWYRHYNEVRPHSSLGYKPPAPEVLISTRPAAQPKPASPGAQSQASAHRHGLLPKKSPSVSGFQ
jgi:putative transposase